MNSCMMFPKTLSIGWVLFLAGVMLFWIFPAGIILAVISALFALIGLFSTHKLMAATLLCLNLALGSFVFFMAFFGPKVIIFPDTFKSFQPKQSIPEAINIP